jgi:hypothetical protein
MAFIPERWTVYLAAGPVGSWNQVAVLYTNLMQSRLGSISIIAMCFRWRVILPKDFTARLSSIQRRDARQWIMKW